MWRDDRTGPGRPWRELLLVALALAAVAVVVLGANPLRGETVAPMDLLQTEPGWQELALDIPAASPHRTDVLDGLLPRWLFLKRAVRGGGLPSWNPLAGFGEPGWPLLFNGYLTPRFVAFVLLGDAAGFHLGLIVQMLVAGLGGYLLARRFVTAAPAFFAAVTFTLCGFNVAWLMWPHTATAAMLPWVVWAWWRVLEGVPSPPAAAPTRPAAGPAAAVPSRAARRRGVTLAVCVALLVVAGFPAVAVYGAYLCAGLTLAWLLRRDPAADRPRSAGKAVLAAAAGGLGVGLAAVQLVPSLEFLRFFDLGHRGPVGAAVDPRQLLLAPLPGGLAPDPETCGFVGLTALLLLLVGAAPLTAASAPGLRFPVRFWTTALGGSLILALRFPRPLADLLYRLPGLGINPNNRALVVFGLAAAMLAAIGLERLVAVVRRRARRPLAAVAAVAIAVSGLQITDLARVSRAQNAIVPARSFLPPTSVTRWLADHLQPGQNVIAEGFSTGGTLSGYGIGELFSHGFFTSSERRLLDRLVGDAWVTRKAARPSLRAVHYAAAPWFDLLSVRYLVGPCAIMRSQLMPGATAQLTADRPVVVAAGRALHQPIVIAEPTPINGIAVLLSQDQPDPATQVAVTLANGAGSWSAIALGAPTGNGAIGWCDLALATPSVLAPGSYTLTLTVTGGPLAVWGSGGRFAFYLLDPLEVPPELAAAWRPALVSHPLCVLENPAAPAGASLVGPPVAPAEVLARGNGYASYRVHSDGPGTLVRSTRAYPGWQVTVNGRRHRPAVAFEALQATDVPAGESVVSWRYRPLSVAVGLAISLLALLLSGLAWWRP